jgi:anti-anti-sigma regulatory factor
MEFKIYTKATYTLITPISDSINAKLTAALRQKCTELAKDGSKNGNNYIVDLQQCLQAEKEGLKKMAALSGSCYEQMQSMVFTGIKEPVMQVIKQMELDDVMNICPKMIEAIDIISMEQLERDLMNGDEEETE